MKTLQKLTILLLAVFLVTACSKDAPSPYSVTQSDEAFKANEKAGKVTGSLEIEWKGAEKGSDAGNKPEDLQAFIDFNAHEASGDSEAKGKVVYTVQNPDLTPHREIQANVVGAITDPEISKAWVVAVVFADTKGCDGENGEHGSGAVVCTDVPHQAVGDPYACRVLAGNRGDRALQFGDGWRGVDGEGHERGCCVGDGGRWQCDRYRTWIGGFGPAMDGVGGGRHGVGDTRLSGWWERVCWRLMD